MARVITGTISGGNPAFSVSQYDPIIVGSTGVIRDADIGILGSGDASVTVLGTIDAWFFAVQLVGNSNYLRIGASGVLNNDSSFGAWLGTNNTSTNNTRVNEGYIQGANGGLYVQGSGTKISNLGEIRAVYSGAVILSSGARSATNSIYNKGTISTQPLETDPSRHFSIKGSLTSDQVTNEGFIYGGIRFFEGNDLYDGRLGTIVGEIDPGKGNDIALGGAGSESFIGGIGNDTIDGGAGNDSYIALKNGSSDVAVDLRVETAQAIGGYGHDVIRNIENVTSYGGNDHFIGNDATNILIAGDGSDTLDGGLGDDRLDGGAVSIPLSSPAAAMSSWTSGFKVFLLIRDMEPTHSQALKI